MAAHRCWSPAGGTAFTAFCVMLMPLSGGKAVVRGGGANFPKYTSESRMSEKRHHHHHLGNAACTAFLSKNINAFRGRGRVQGGGWKAFSDRDSRSAFSLVVLLSFVSALREFVGLRFSLCFFLGLTDDRFQVAGWS